jgi:hypothetical protein
MLAIGLMVVGAAAGVIGIDAAAQSPPETL